ncbi:hypothetical protein ACFP2F_05705 [Hymenobacter artigasi]|uniref:Uncharacterized protein n=1 Tax=Hymenobacter artigasi TaxID=2719616 RepID=A0ABX1HDR9_9BACT|nr:hypothetical protein [Hymenobacter artigasi]NKI88355.1 hypothetical protein [Hymenobacter artigasi]
MKKQVYRVLRRIFRRHLIAPSRLIPRRRLSAVFASEVERNELYCEVEQACYVQLDDAELRRAETFQALVAYVVRCLAA